MAGRPEMGASHGAVAQQYGFPKDLKKTKEEKIN